MAGDTEIGGTGRAFMTTPWTDIVRMKELPPRERRRRLGFLIDRYWQPVYFYIRRTGRSNADSKDLTQAFFAKVIETGLIDRTDPVKGRFRNYLLKSLSRFISDKHVRDAGSKPVFPPGTLFVEKMSNAEIPALKPSHDSTPEKEFNRQWVVSLLNTILLRLKQMCEKRGSSDTFKVFERRFVHRDPSTYGANEQIARDMGITARQVESHYKKALRWYRYLLREEVATCVEKQSEIEEEIRDLWRILGQ